jgi:hypothetical protein
MYKPPRYFYGLSKTKKLQKLKEMKKFGKMSWKDPKAYVGFKTDKGVKSKTSSYTRKFYKLAPNAKSLKQKAEFTKVPLKFIKESYNRGLAAWRTGHRPGATEQQWGYARVHSFLTCGKTYLTADSDLARKAKKTKSARRWFNKTCKSTKDM